MKVTICCATLLAFTFLSEIAAESNWPNWRGPSRNGLSPDKGLPVNWGPTENIVWKTALPSWGAGTPIVWGDRIFVISASGTEADAVEPTKRGGDAGGPALLLICIAKETGTVLWQRELDRGNQYHRKHNLASPSPVTDGKNVWAVAGTGMVSAFDMEGEQLWRKNLQELYGPFGLIFGYAASPLLFDNKLVIEVLHGYKTDDPSYLVAFDAVSGDVTWHQERPTDAVRESPDAYTTPTLLRRNGKSEIVVSGADYVTGHDPDSGAELWRIAGLNPEKEGNYRVVGSPVVVDGMIYAPTRKRPLLAIRADDDRPRIAWRFMGKAAPDVPTPVSDGSRFFMVDDQGIATCLDAKTGEAVWGPERTAQGVVSASPILADGKLFITNENAVTTVLEAGPVFKMLATNELDGSYTLSSLAVSDSRIFIRTATHLYCIAKT